MKKNPLKIRLRNGSKTIEKQFRRMIKDAKITRHMEIYENMIDWENSSKYASFWRGKIGNDRRWVVELWVKQTDHIKGFKSTINACFSISVLFFSFEILLLVYNRYWYQIWRPTLLRFSWLWLPLQMRNGAVLGVVFQVELFFCIISWYLEYQYHWLLDLHLEIIYIKKLCKMFQHIKISKRSNMENTAIKLPYPTLYLPILSLIYDGMLECYCRMTLTLSRNKWKLSSCFSSSLIQLGLFSNIIDEQAHRNIDM